MIDDYENRFPKAFQRLKEDLDDLLSFYSIPDIDKKGIFSTNGQEQLSQNIHRRSRSVSIFPSDKSSVSLTTCYLVEYA